MKILMIGNGFDLEHGLPTKYTDFLDYIITFRGYYARVYQGQVKPRCDADKGDYFEKLFSDKKNHYKVEALQAMTKDNLWIDYFIKVREQHLKNKENWIDFGFDLEKRAIKMPIGLNESLRRTIWSLVLMNICRRIVELQRLILLNSRSFISGFIKEQAMNTRSGCWQMNRKCYIYSVILWMLRTGISCGNSSSGMMLRR